MRRYPSTIRDYFKRCGGIAPQPRRRWELRLASMFRDLDLSG
jgi:hypothetical protein